MEGHWLTQRLRGWGERPALIWRNHPWSYDQLCDATEIWRAELARRGIEPGTSLAICGDYSPKLCALLLAALLNRNIIVPLASAMEFHQRRRNEARAAAHCSQLSHIAALIGPGHQGPGHQGPGHGGSQWW